MILWRENSYSSSLTYSTYCKSSQSRHGWQDQNLCSRLSKELSTGELQYPTVQKQKRKSTNAFGVYSSCL